MTLRDLTTVDWLYVIILAALVFVATLIGSIFSFGNRLRAAVISAVVFAGLFVLWSYYPHHVPLPTAMKIQKPETLEPAPATPAASEPTPATPQNPVKDITAPPQPAR
jgi:hypothetical protein